MEQEKPKDEAKAQAPAPAVSSNQPKQPSPQGQQFSANVEEIPDVPQSPPPEIEEGTIATDPTTPPEAKFKAEEGANVVLSADMEHKALTPGVTNIGNTTVIVPEVEQQLAGFKVDEPGVFVTQFRQFKFWVKKGDNVPPATLK
jgi:hypothetical protein